MAQQPHLDINGKVAEHVQNEDLEALERVISLGYIHHMRDGYRGGNVLHHCIWHRKGKAARFLIKEVPVLQCGVDVRGQTPLMYAFTIFQQDVELLQLMASVVPDLINKQDTDLGSTALLLAISKDCTSDSGLRAIKILMDAGASVDIRDSKGHSAFYYAFKKNAEKLMEMLFEAGVKVEIQDIICQDIRIAREQWPVVVEILKRNPTLINAEYKGCTLLMKIIRSNMLRQAEYLLQLGALPDIGDGALVQAVQCLNLEICHLILTHNRGNVSKYANALVLAASKSVLLQMIDLIFNLEEVKNFKDFNYEPNEHPQTIALYKVHSPPSLRYIANHPYLKNDTLGMDFTSYPHLIPELFQIPFEFPDPVHLTPISISLVDQRYRFYEEPGSLFLDIMLEANYTAASPDNSFVSPLSLLLCVSRDEMIDPFHVDMFHTLCVRFLQNGADVDQRIFNIIGETPSVQYLREELKVPDALLAALWAKQGGAILRLLPFWQPPPPMLCLAADQLSETYDFHQRVKMLKFLLQFGIPHGSEDFQILKQFINRIRPCGFDLSAFKEYCENPLSLEKLSILAVRRACKVEKGSQLPNALATLPVPRTLVPRLQFKLSEVEILSQDCTIVTTLGDDY